MKTILVFSGSQRKESHNQRLAAYLADLMSDSFQIDMLHPSDIEFPLFNQDLEKNIDLIEKIAAIHARFMRADGFLMVCPEYNGSVTPFLKNTVDWISRLPRISPERFINPLQEKPLLLASATAGGSGGILGLQSARQIFTYLGCLILAEQICMPFAQKAWSDDGRPKDDYINNYIEHAMARFGAVNYGN